MGKLHTLRRAIEREPEKWFDHETWFAVSVVRKKKNPREYKWRVVKGAERFKQSWEPAKYRRKYNGFVFSVLKEMGYEDLI